MFGNRLKWIGPCHVSSFKNRMFKKSLVLAQKSNRISNMLVNALENAYFLTASSLNDDI